MNPAKPGLSKPSILHAMRLDLALRAAAARAIAGAVAWLCISGAQGATLTVTSFADSGAGSLREAILAANASVGVADTIRFHASGTIVLASRLPDISDELTIDGAGQHITISGNDAVQVLFVGAGASLNLKAITIAAGRCASPCSGGAVLNVGTLKVTDCTFTGNSALLGGAIHNFGALEVTGSTFSGNAARIGGAIHNFDRLVVTDSRFVGNSAVVSGGAIHNFDALTVIDSSFSANSVAGAQNDLHNLGTLSLADRQLANAAPNGAGRRTPNHAVRAMLTISGAASEL